MLNKTSDIIIKYLKEKNISQINLSKLINVTPQYINAILKDKKPLSKNIFNKIVKVLKISENDKNEIIKYEYSKKSINIYNSVNEIKQFGVYNNNGFEVVFNNISIKLLNLKENMKIFFIKINTNKLENIYENEYLFFEKSEKIFENKIHLLEFDNKLELAYLEFIDNKIILKYLNKELKHKILLKSKISKIKIIGNIIGKYIEK